MENKTCYKNLINASNVENLVEKEDATIAQALEILKYRSLQSETIIDSPDVLKKYLILKLSQEEREIFSIIWLDVKYRIIAFEDNALGTLTHCSVYTREILKSALKHNAAACILVHNHPSGSAEPSSMDHKLTKNLKEALDFVETRVVDHIVVAGTTTYSFVEHGCI